MKTLHRTLSLAMALVMAISLAACGSSAASKSTPASRAASGSTAATSTANKEKKKYKFGVIYNANNAFWDKVGQGATDKAAELTKSGDYDIEIYAAGPATNAVTDQMQLFEDMMSQNYDGI